MKKVTEGNEVNEERHELHEFSLTTEPWQAATTDRHGLLTGESPDGSGRFALASTRLLREAVLETWRNQLQRFVARADAFSRQSDGTTMAQRYAYEAELDKTEMSIRLWGRSET